MSEGLELTVSAGLGSAWPFRDEEAQRRFLRFREKVASGCQAERVLFLVPTQGVAVLATALARSLEDAASPWSRIFGRLLAGDLNGVLPLAFEEQVIRQGRLHVVHDWLAGDDAKAFARLLLPFAGEHPRPSWVVVVAVVGLAKPEDVGGAVVVDLAPIPDAVLARAPDESFAV